MPSYNIGYPPAGTTANDNDIHIFEESYAGIDTAHESCRRVARTLAAIE